MTKQLRSLLIALGALVVLGGVLAVLLLRPGEPAPSESSGISEDLLLVVRAPEEVARIEVQNENGSYSIQKEGTGHVIDDLPHALINEEYLGMALDEASLLAAIDIAAENSDKLDTFGLASPAATVRITYTDGSAAVLKIGDVLEIADGRYVQLEGDDKVYLFDRARTIRFTMPVENYISYVVTPPRDRDSALAIVREAVFSGSDFAFPFAMHAFDTSVEADVLDSMPFGALTHLITSPQPHEMDQTYGEAVFSSLMGIISEEVVAYNVTEQEAAAYGFDEPNIAVHIVYQNLKDGPIEEFGVRLVKAADGKLLLMRDGYDVVYRIADDAWVHTTYEGFVSRSLIAPFITDISALTVTTSDGASRRYTLTGEKNDITASLDGRELDIENFRRYYQLIASLSHDGNYTPDADVSALPVLASIVFEYRGDRAPSTVRLYPGPLRRVYVEMDSVVEFTMREAFVEKLEAATRALLAGETVSSYW